MQLSEQRLRQLGGVGAGGEDDYLRRANSSEEGAISNARARALALHESLDNDAEFDVGAFPRYFTLFVFLCSTAFFVACIYCNRSGLVLSSVHDIKMTGSNHAYREALLFSVGCCVPVFFEVAVLDRSWREKSRTLSTLVVKRRFWLTRLMLTSSVLWPNLYLYLSSSPNEPPSVVEFYAVFWYQYFLLSHAMVLLYATVIRKIYNPFLSVFAWLMTTIGALAYLAHLFNSNATYEIYLNISRAVFGIGGTLCGGAMILFYYQIWLGMHQPRHAEQGEYIAPMAYVSAVYMFVMLILICIDWAVAISTNEQCAGCTTDASAAIHVFNKTFVTIAMVTIPVRLSRNEVKNTKRALRRVLDLEASQQDEADDQDFELDLSLGLAVVTSNWTYAWNGSNWVYINAQAANSDVAADRNFSGSESSEVLPLQQQQQQHQQKQRAEFEDEEQQQFLSAPIPTTAAITTDIGLQLPALPSSSFNSQALAYSSTSPTNELEESNVEQLPPLISLRLREVLEGRDWGKIKTILNKSTRVQGSSGRQPWQDGPNEDARSGSLMSVSSLSNDDEDREWDWDFGEGW